jgi:hypothetical protein
MFLARILPSSTPIWSTRSSVSARCEARGVARTKRVDAPDDALGEDLVLVERDERAERRGRELREHDAVARAVALEHLALHERLARVLRQLRAHLVLGLPERERLRLREEVREQDPVVLRALDRVQARRGREEVRRDQLRALVHELVERVLPVRARGAPDDRLRRASAAPGWSEEPGRTPVW